MEYRFFHLFLTWSTIISHFSWPRFTRLTLLETSSLTRAFSRDRARETRYPGPSCRSRASRARSRDALAARQNNAVSFRNGLRRQKRSFVHKRARETRTNAQLNRRRFRRNHFHRDKYRRAHFATTEIKQNAVSTRAIAYLLARERKRERNVLC